MGAIILSLAMSILACASSAWALEFSAEQVVRVEGRTRSANVYHRDGMWRLEHDRGPIGVTILREDRGETWLLIPRIRKFKRVSLDRALLPMLAVSLEGEIAREAIGTEVRDGYRTTLYEVIVHRVNGREAFYQWVADDLGVPLKLVPKTGEWSVEYRQMRVHSIASEFFDIPHRYWPIAE
jgi:hypothetical protein